MAEQSGGGLPDLPGPISQFFGTVGSDLNPVTIGKSLLHPLDTLKNTFGPGAWLTPEEGVKKGAEAPIPEIAGHAASILLAHQLPSMAKGSVDVARKAGPVVAGAAKGGWQASTAPSTFKFRGVPVEIPVPAALSSAGVGYEIGRHIPFVNPEIGGAVGGAVGGVVPGIRGAYRGAMNVLRPPEMPPPGGGEPPPPGSPSSAAPPPPGAPAAAAPAPVVTPPPPGVDPATWGQLTPEIRDAIYRGAAARKGATPGAIPAYSTTTPENISVIPEAVRDFSQFKVGQNVTVNTGMGSRLSNLTGKIVRFVPDPTVPGQEVPILKLPTGQEWPAAELSRPAQGVIPEGEHNIIRKVAETNRGNKDVAIARSLKDENITQEGLDKMSDADLRARVKALGYTPSYGKNYSRTWDAFRRDLRKLVDPGKLNPPPMPPE